MNTNPTRNIVLVLKPILKARKMSVYRLAIQSGVTNQALYDLINGRTSPTLSTLSKIATALDVTHTELLQTVEK